MREPEEAITASAHDAEPTGAETESRNPFHSRWFGRWWLGSLVAGTGIGIQAVTVPLFIRDRVELDARSVAIAGALIAQTLPGAFLTLVGGTLADRIERRRILAVTFSLAAIVSSAYVVLSVLDVRAIWPVFPLAAIVGAAGSFTNPARQSMLPHLVTRRQLQNGVILGTMGFMASLQFLGPTVGGLLVDLQSLTAAFGLEVVLLALAAVVFSQVRSHQPAASGATVLSDLRAGIRHVLERPPIYGLLLLGAIPGVFFVGPFSVTIPLLVPDILHASDKWVGILWGCFGAGVVSGSMLLTLRPIPRRGMAVCLSTVLGGAILVLFGFSQSLWLTALVLILWGHSASIFINYVVTLLQENVEPQMMGRVMSMYSLVFFVSMPLGYGQAGLLTRAFGIQATLITSGLSAILAGTVCLLTLKQVRSLK